MSGIHQMMLLGGGRIVSPFTAWAVGADATPGVNATATLTINTDGTVTGVGTPADTGTPGTANWFSPTSTGIGSIYWVRFTATTGTFTTNGASTFTQISSALSVTKAATTLSGSVAFTIEIASDSGGSNIVFTSTSNTLSYDHTL